MKVYKISKAPANGVYIGRGSAWGNPYVIGKHGDRDRVIELYEVYAKDREAKEPDWLSPLIGKDLVCYCAPLACHGDVLIKMIERK